MRNFAMNLSSILPVYNMFFCILNSKIKPLHMSVCVHVGT